MGMTLAMSWYEYDNGEGFLDAVVRVLVSLALSPILGIFANAIVYMLIIVLSAIQSTVQQILEGDSTMDFNAGLLALALSMLLNSALWYRTVGSVEHIDDALKMISLISTYVIAMIMSLI